MRTIILILATVTTLIFTACNSDKNKNIFYGNVDVRTVSLGFRVAGRVDAINFEEGQRLKRGDIIASLDSSLYREYLNQIQAQIQIQKAKLQKLQNGYRAEEITKAKATLYQKTVAKEKARKDLDRVEKLYKSSSISDQNYDDAKALYDNADALYLYAKSNLALLENGYQKEDILEAASQLELLLSKKRQREIDLNDTNIYAPTDGTLLTRVYEVGSIVNGSQTVVEIAKDDEYWIRSYMSERYLGIIKAGMEANIYTDSNPTKTYKGIVSFISPLAEFTPKNVQTQELRTDLVYRFKIVLKNPDDMIRQGMPVSVIFPNIESPK